MWNKEKARNLWYVNVNVCPESFACQQTWRLGGEMRCYARAHTRLDDPASFVGLQVKRNSLSQTLTVNILPFPSCSFMVFHFMCYSQSSWEPSWFVALQSNSLVDYYPLFGVLWTVCMEQWEEIVSDYLEAADNWFWYLSSPVDSSVGQPASR